jgi:hypothetical protein
MPVAYKPKTDEERSKLVAEIEDRALKHVLQRLKAKPCQTCKSRTIGASELAEINTLIARTSPATKKPASAAHSPSQGLQGDARNPSDRPRDALDDVLDAQETARIKTVFQNLPISNKE